jgi:ketosteroid isomerase-like protein
MSVIANAYDFSSPAIVTRMTALYPDAGNVVSASEGQIVSSADSVRAGIAHFWQEAGQNMRNARWVWDEVHVSALSPDAAVLTGTWSIPHIAPHGGEHIIRGAWTAVFRRGTDGAWKIVHEHLSSPPEAH